MKKRYVIIFGNEQEYSLYAGTAYQVVTQMRSECRTPSSSRREFRHDFARRHNYLCRPKIHGLTDSIFIETLSYSPVAWKVFVSIGKEHHFTTIDMNRVDEMNDAELIDYLIWYRNCINCMKKDIQNLKILEDKAVRM